MGYARKLIVEFIGTFTLIYVGVGVVLLTDGKDLVAIALAHGLAIGLMVMAAGHISGGVYNPALTCGLMAARKLEWPVGVAYIVVQLLGGLVGAGLMLVSLGSTKLDPALNFATPGLASGVTPIQGVVVEAILTFFLMFSVFGNAVDQRSPKAVAGLAIGLTITMGVFAGGGLTGGAMNPARWFGPALLNGTFANWWVYLVGPILGAVLAALLYNEVLLEEPAKAATPTASPTPASRPSNERRAERRGRLA